VDVNIDEGVGPDSLGIEFVSEVGIRESKNSVDVICLIETTSPLKTLIFLRGFDVVGLKLE
jgi:hypothetical protein